MNRIDFMKQLDSLLQNISPTEREEALQYYNDYFDDAGADHEQEVIEALGNPARVAENIKRDLFGNIGEGSSQRAKASDRAVIEYCQNGADAGQDAWQGGGSGQEDSFGQRGSFEQRGGSGQGGSFGQGGGSGQGAGWSGNGMNGQGSACGQPDSGKKPEMPAWGAVLLIVLLVLASPIIIPLALGLIATLAGLLLAWFGVILGFGVTAICLIAMLVVLLCVGLGCVVVDPLVSVGLAGGALICGGIGILFLMLTVAMAGIVTPLMFKGIGWLFHSCRK